MVVSDFSKVTQTLVGRAATETPLICLLKMFRHNAAWEQSQRKCGDRDGKQRGWREEGERAVKSWVVSERLVFRPWAQGFIQGPWRNHTGQLLNIHVTGSIRFETHTNPRLTTELCFTV